jgi:adenylyltransferase/sulfurtransferase
VGSLAAVEAIKVLTGFGQPLAGQMLTFDTETQEFRKFKLARWPECPVCGHLQ